MTLWVHVATLAVEKASRRDTNPEEFKGQGSLGEFLGTNLLTILHTSEFVFNKCLSNSTDLWIHLENKDWSWQMPCAATIYSTNIAWQLIKFNHITLILTLCTWKLFVRQRLLTRKLMLSV